MSVQRMLEQIKTLITPVLEKANIELYNIEYVKEGKSFFLRVYIDKEGGVDLTDCTNMSEVISEKLDEADIISDMYYLEVSSPGAEKPLKTEADFLNNIGENVYITLYAQINGEKSFEGTLLSFEASEATVEYKWKHTKKKVSIPFKNIAKARLSVML